MSEKTERSGPAGRLWGVVTVAFALLAAVAWALAAAGHGRDASGGRAGDRIGGGDEIRSYLLAHPEVVIEAIERWQQTQQQEIERERSRRLGAVWQELAHDGVSPVIGPEDAPVTVIEYYDYRCPYCRRAHRDTRRLLAAYDGRIRYVFKQFPVLDRPGDPPVSRIAAKAAAAAFRQGCFAAYHEALMTSTGGLSRARIMKLAQDAGCDLPRLEQAMADPKIDRYLEQTLAMAHALGVAGTPTYVINGRLLEGAVGYDKLKEAVDDALAEAER